MLSMMKTTFKKIVTSGYGDRPFPNKSKFDMGFAETIRWISTKYSGPRLENDEPREYFVIMPDGNVKKLWYGSGNELVKNAVYDDNCDGLFLEYEEETDENGHFSGKKQVTNIDDLRYFGTRWFGWYEEEEYEDRDDCGEWCGYRYQYKIFGNRYKETSPLYFLEQSFGNIPKDEDLEEEYWERRESCSKNDECRYELQDIPCPYDYDKEEKGE